MKLEWLDYYADLDTVLTIDKLSYAVPLRKRPTIDILDQNKCMSCILREDKKILGFIFYNLFAKTFFVWRMAIHPAYRELGFGSFIVERMKEKLSPTYRHTISVIVDERNLSSQLFLKHRDFKAIKIIPNYFDDYDGYCMIYSIGDTNA